MRNVSIGDRVIGSGSPMYIIAEIGLSPGKSLEKGLALVDAAADAGADCAKFQIFTPEEIVSRNGRVAQHFKGTNIVDAYRDMEFPREHYDAIVARCKERSITFSASVFDDPALTFLDRFSPPAYKIAAFELGDRFLLEAVASRGKPIILSTGMASLSNVERAIEIIERAGNNQIVLLHTVSAYPARPEDYNLRAIETLRVAFGYPTGVSDHTQSLEVPIAAAALGASVIEKHIALDRNGGGPDDSFSLEPQMLTDMVAAIRRVEAMLGDGRKRRVASEDDIHDRLRLALVARNDAPVGSVLTRDSLSIKRAGGGVAPDYLDIVLGRRLVRPVQADEPIEWTHLFGDDEAR